MNQTVSGKSSNTFFLLLILILLIFVGGFYYFYTRSNDSEIQNINVSSKEDLIDGIILVSGGDKEQAEFSTFTEVANVNYDVLIGTQQEIIENIEKFALSQGWLIRSSQVIEGQAAPGINLYEISLFNQNSKENVQIVISSQRSSNHSLLITHAS